jgi:uncharacterized repeat protein (TIGR02543 family)
VVSQVATGYIPNSTGWSKQSSGPLYYTGWLRLYYSTSYNAATNTSTVTITPQFKSSANLGNDYRFWADANTTDAGLWGGQAGSETKLYTLPTGGYSASGYLKCGQAHNDFVNITNSDGSAFSKSFTIQHDSSGAASFKAGIKCTVTTMYTPGQDGISNAGQKLSDAVSVTGSTYVLTTAVSPSGYGTVTAGATLAPTSTKSLTATPAAATAQYTYAFSSWSNTAGTLSSTTSNPTTFTMGTSAATVTANFTRTPKNYTVSYDANGGSGAPASQTKTYNQTLTLSSTVPTRTGYTFKGWGTSSSATTPSYQPGGSYTANAAATLYAIWQKITYTLTLTTSGTGVAVNVLRTSSPIGGASSGLLSNGATLYHNDVIKISYAVSSGYTLSEATVNSTDISGVTEYTVSAVTGNLSVKITVDVGAIVYIANQPYQAYIGDGSNWNLYKAYIGNGSSFDGY